uniref:Uncharacterized protein n=1 Tax=Globisporangium ultimum (strain ATCC 200006 / CBS 805.95 / DAOM BR144) TaxID=431595 RepID=K3W9Z6_GLOUD
MSAAPAPTLKKKAKKRRDERDESEFVSVEVGMREFQRRLANSKTSASATRKPTLAEIRAEMLRAQQERVEVAPPVAIANAPVPAELPVPATETDPIKNEFIDDDFDEDLAFMQALDAVEKTLASTKPASIPAPSPRDNFRWSSTLPQLPPSAAIQREIGGFDDASGRVEGV